MEKYKIKINEQSYKSDLHISREAFAPLLEYYSSMSFSVEPIKSALNEYVKQVFSTLDTSVISSALDVFTKDLLVSMDFASPARAILDEFNEYFISSLDMNFNEIYSILDNCTSILEALPENTDEEAPDDYVTFVKPESKEWDISETIAIPIGNNKVRMKTSDFISLLSSIIAALAIIIPLIYGRIDAASNAQYEQQSIEIEQEQNQLLSDFLSSIDSSNSYQAEAVEDLKKSVLNLQSELVELQDTVRDLESSVRDLDCPSESQEESPDILPLTDGNNLE